LVILDWLSQDLSDLFARDGRARVALWCDAKAEFQHLVPSLQGRLAGDGIALLAFDLSQDRGALWLKWAAEAGVGAGRKVVIWLPYGVESVADGAADGVPLGGLLEYVYGGLLWTIEGDPPTLFRFLRKHGVPLPTQRAEQAPLWRGGADSPLAKYVRTHLHRDAAFWTSRTLSVAAIEESIVGNVEERLLRFLADPEHEWAVLREAGIADEFSSQVERRYADAAGLAQDPQGWAEGFVGSLILLEVFEATGEREDFPFAGRLPAPGRRSAARELLQHWMRDRDHFETFQRWARTLDPKLDLRAWSRGVEGRPQALPSLAIARWAAYLQGLREQGTSEAGLRQYIRDSRDLALQESEGFWAKGTGDLPGWALVVRLADLIALADEAIQAAEEVQTAAALVEAYAAGWHRIDLAHWRLLADARRAEDLELLAAVADRFYTRYLDRAGRAFYDRLESATAGSTWPPPGCRPVVELASTLYAAPHGRRAVLVVDALRYDLAAALQERLGEGTLEAYVASVPSETWVGMTSLLPAPDVRLEVSGGGAPRLLSDAAGGDLAYRQYRWKLLDQAGAGSLGMDAGGARQDELRHLRQMTSAPRNLPQVLVLFERGVDQLGHSTGHEVLRHFEELLGELERSIRKLRSWGYGDVHVVTDHGFVLLHSSAGIQQLTVDAGRFTLLRARYGLLQEGREVGGVTAVPFPLDPRWRVALPPGLRSFSSPGAFFHGGATLQEVVIPHLRLESAAPRSRMGVRVLVPQVEIATLTVKIELMPEPPPEMDLFAPSPEPLTLRVLLGDPDAPRSNEKTVEVGPERTVSFPVTLFLNREPPISAGEEIPIHVIDTATGKDHAVGLFVRAARDLD
jgi:hypothetical protein